MNSGKMGERKACEYLETKGYEILEVNFHSRFGEIDIIAKDGETVVFAEVKTRKNDQFGTPAEFVTPAKMKKIIKTAYFYLGDMECDMRFDVLEVYYGVKNEINHIENAFGGDYEIFGD